MSMEPALLATIRANPSDDTPRLVYADWLQENDQETWADLIRTQIELSRPAPPRPPSMVIDLYSTDEHIRAIGEWSEAQQRRPELDRRERELLGAFRPPLPDGWVVRRGLGLAVRGERGDLFFRRGLGERVVCGGAIWLADGDSILAAHPVERVRLTTRPPYGEFGRRPGREGSIEYLYCLGVATPDDGPSVALWVGYQPDDSATGRVLLLLLARRWPNIAFEFAR